MVNFRNFFRKLKVNKLDNDLNNALKVVIPKIEKKWIEIKSFIMAIPNQENEIKIISGVQKEFFIKTMEIRFEQLLKKLV
ncbi:MAG: hypothetical protein SPL00_00895 [Bacilli bacterium]|nr:hypothetical protein [Bacilli bacterium]